MVTGFELGADDSYCKAFRPGTGIQGEKRAQEKGQEPVRAAGRGSACGHCEGDCNQDGQEIILSALSTGCFWSFEPAG